MSRKMKTFKKYAPPTDINTEENQAFKKAIDEQIDLMEQYKPYNYIVTILRSDLIASKGPYKTRAAELVEKNGGLYTEETNLGILKYYKTTSLSRRKEIIMAALEEEGLDYGQIMDEMQEMEERADGRRYVIKVDLSTFCHKPEIVSRMREELDLFYEEKKKVESSDRINGHIAASIYWIRKNMEKHRMYLAAYNNMKSIFDKASRIGHFPRLYVYNGIVLLWDVIQCLPSFEQQMKAYFALKDDGGWRRVLLRMVKIRERNEELRYMYSLDNYRYDEEIDDEDENDILVNSL